jgi:DNA-damage-inducible protein J
MLLHQIVLRKGLPFEARIPNEETAAAIEELEAGKGERFAGTGKDLIDHVLGTRKRRKV